MSHFFAMLSRMKHINRWGLMRNTSSENLCEHSYDVAVLAHALALIKNKRLGGQVNADRAAVLALFHDASEILTGDMPTPIKYYNPSIRREYKQIEKVANQKLLSLLPPDLREEYAPAFDGDSEDAEIRRIIKAADKLSALIKCLQEQTMGNREFDSAARSQRAQLDEMNLPEVNIFMEEFLPGYLLTLDEIN